MDAGNRVGPEGAASLAPALEKMPQLTSLDLFGAQIRFWARPRGVRGIFVSLVRAVGEHAWKRSMCCGWGARLRAGDACDG